MASSKDAIDNFASIEQAGIDVDGIREKRFVLEDLTPEDVALIRTAGFRRAVEIFAGVVAASDPSMASNRSDTRIGNDGSVIALTTQKNSHSDAYVAALTGNTSTNTPRSYAEPAVSSPQEAQLLLSMGFSSDVQMLLNPVSEALLHKAKEALLAQLRQEDSAIAKALVDAGFDPQNVQLYLTMGKNNTVNVEAEHLDGSARQFALAFSLHDPNKVQTGDVPHDTSAGKPA